jgi:arylsulfatase A-like enzyme
MLSFYDTTIRVPLIFRYPPRIPAGQVNDELVSLIDVAATILDVCGLPADALSGSGRSLLDADRAPRQFVVAENDRPVNGIQLLKGAFPDFDTTPIDSRVRMLRTARYKLVWRTVGPSEFYDLEADPGELHDLGAAPSEAQAALERMLEEWQRRNEGDPASTRFESEDAASLERLRALGYLE